MLRSSNTKPFFELMPYIVGISLIVATIVQTLFGVAVGERLFIVILIVGCLPYAVRMLKDLAAGHFGVDVIALLAVFTSLALHEIMAGAVILFMLSGGEALEEYALRRARLQLTQLLKRAPSIAHVKHGQSLKDIPINLVALGDRLLVKSGEIIPVDGIILEGASSIDESMITGESLPVEKTVSQLVSSGSVNVGGLLTIQALKTSKDSKYEQIIRLIKEAEQQRAPLIRLADKYSAGFTLVTLSLAGFAWFISGSALRALEVLVVATPCPLLIATPVAIMSGISVAASRGIIVKNGGALETLARVKGFIFDKTGTITFGTPKISQILSYGASETEVLQLAASIDQLSTHILARSLVKAAQKKKLVLQNPSSFQETLAQGVSAVINEETYLLGKMAFLEANGVTLTAESAAKHAELRTTGAKTIFLAQGKTLLGGISFLDEIRQDTKDVFSRLRAEGITSITLLSGDKSAVAKKIGAQVGVDQVLGDLAPEDKVKELQRLKQTIHPLAMVGDGVNDAPALAAADVGIAMGSHGDTAASETADIVISVDSLSRVAEAVHISKRMLHIALQSIGIGMGASFVLMLIATTGYLKPVTGAILQEGIDVIVILNALRVHQRKNILR